MDRIKPPPSYYGNPYQGGMEPGAPYGQGQFNGQPPYQGNPMGQGNGNQPPIPNGQGGQEGTYNPYTSEVPMTFNTSLENFVGKRMKVYCSFPDSAKWHDVIFEGSLVYAANDQVILRDLETKQLVAIVGVYVNYVEIFE